MQNSKQIYENKLAWAAGFMDADGCFGLSPTYSKPKIVAQPVVQCAQVKIEPLEILSGLFDGTVRPCGTTSSGNQFYEWRITGARDIEKVCNALIPYLILKKREAEILRQFCSTVIGRGYKVPDEALELRKILLAEMQAIKAS